jgi:hypothetical protein
VISTSSGGYLIVTRTNMIDPRILSGRWIRCESIKAFKTRQEPEMKKGEKGAEEVSRACTRSLGPRGARAEKSVSGIDNGVPYGR